MSIHIPTSFVLVLVLCVVMELCSPFFFKFLSTFGLPLFWHPKKGLSLSASWFHFARGSSCHQQGCCYLLKHYIRGSGNQEEWDKKAHWALQTHKGRWDGSQSRGEKVNNVSVITPEASHYHHGKGSAQQKSHEGQQLGGPETLPGHHIARKALGHFVQL